VTSNAALLEYAKAQLAAAQALFDALNDDADTDGRDVETTEPAKPAGRRPTRKATPAKSEPEPEPEDDDEDGEDQAEDEDFSDDDEIATERRKELNTFKILALKALAKKRGFKPDAVNSASKADLIDAIVGDEQEEREKAAESTAKPARPARAAAAKKAVEPEPDEDEDDSEDDEDGDVDYTRDDIIKMGLRKAKALAKEQGASDADLRGLKVEDVADLILGDDDSEDDDADTDDDSAGSDDADDAEDYYTRADFEKMSDAELKQIGREYEKEDPDFKMPARIKREALINLLLGDE
jgi:hypothetical protein